MSDKGKTAAIEKLRREVGFGCPVCRSPFLEWHHFDPPWHIEQHWRPEGMIAMCPYCHPDADAKNAKGAGAYSLDELRAMKNKSYSSEDVQGHFPSWQKKSLLIRIGGCYTDTSGPVISVNEIPQIILGKNEADLLSVSFELRQKNDDVLVKMEDNWFTAYPANVHDMIVTPKTKEVMVWLAEEDVGLDLSFRRITLAELDGLLELDRRRQENIACDREKQLLAQLPPDQRDFFEGSMREARSRANEPPSDWWLKQLNRLPAELREAQLSGDPVGYRVKQWVQNNCITDDGLIPLLNFEQMAIYFHGERIAIKDGVAGFLYDSAAFGNSKGAVNVACRCATCSRLEPVRPN
jgi:hypothetical protein